MITLKKIKINFSDLALKYDYIWIFLKNLILDPNPIVKTGYHTPPHPHCKARAPRVTLAPSRASAGSTLWTYATPTSCNAQAPPITAGASPEYNNGFAILMLP